MKEAVSSSRWAELRSRLESRGYDCSVKRRRSGADEPDSRRRRPREYAEKYGFHDSDQYVFRIPQGARSQHREEISKMKGEPQWIDGYRLNRARVFFKKPLPTWGGDVSQTISRRSTTTSADLRRAKSWEDVPADMSARSTKLGIPRPSQKFLSGVGARTTPGRLSQGQRSPLEKQGVLFLSCDQGLRDHPRAVQAYFGT